jgi:hypothetical protein
MLARKSPYPLFTPITYTCGQDKKKRKFRGVYQGMKFSTKKVFDDDKNIYGTRTTVGVKNGEVKRLYGLKNDKQWEKAKLKAKKLKKKEMEKKKKEEFDKLLFEDGEKNGQKEVNLDIEFDFVDVEGQVQNFTMGAESEDSADRKNRRGVNGGARWKKNGNVGFWEKKVEDLEDLGGVYNQFDARIRKMKLEQRERQRAKIKMNRKKEKMKKKKEKLKKKKN